MNSYEVVSEHGELLGLYPYTVAGLHDACQHAHQREQSDMFWSIVNPANVDISNPSGLNEKEKQYLLEVWGLV